MMSNYNVKIIKQNDNIICFTYQDNDILYFAKLFYLKTEKNKIEYEREVYINSYINDNLKNKLYYTKLLNIYENILPFTFILPFIKNKEDLCNILIFEHSGFHTLRYYINKLSITNFNNILQQLKDATQYLEDINIIHYDLYCESNIMLKKEKNKWIIKIIDYGLSYIDDTDKSKYDYTIAINSIKYFNKKHIINF